MELKNSINIRGCSSCGNDHYNVRVTNMSIGPFHNFFVCPITGDPVYVKREIKNKNENIGS